MYASTPFSNYLLDIVLDLQGFKGLLRRGFKIVYPWLNTSFELWLLVYNVAYLFDQTPFYRPWLSWIGIDLRRLGVEDFVSFTLFPENAVVDVLTACSLPCGPKELVVREGTATTPTRNFTASAPGLTPVAATNGHLFRQVPGMVVLSRITCPLFVHIAPGSGHPSPENAFTTPTGDSI